MYSVFTPTDLSHCRTTWAVISAPLSERKCVGIPCNNIASASVSITLKLFERRATVIARHAAWWVDRYRLQYHPGNAGRGHGNRIYLRGRDGERATRSGGTRLRVVVKTGALGRGKMHGHVAGFRISGIGAALPGGVQRFAADGELKCPTIVSYNCESVPRQVGENPAGPF